MWVKSSSPWLLRAFELGVYELRDDAGESLDGYAFESRRRVQFPRSN